eukprot:scaffold61069_cov18-Tisochrysis_lutea.AAC.1
MQSSYATVAAAATGVQQQRNCYRIRQPSIKKKTDCCHWLPVCDKLKAAIAGDDKESVKAQGGEVQQWTAQCAQACLPQGPNAADIACTNTVHCAQHTHTHTHAHYTGQAWAGNYVPTCMQCSPAWCAWSHSCLDALLHGHTFRQAHLLGGLEITQAGFMDAVSHLSKPAPKCLQHSPAWCT